MGNDLSQIRSPSRALPRSRTFGTLGRSDTAWRAFSFDRIQKQGVELLSHVHEHLHADPNSAPLRGSRTFASAQPQAALAGSV
jgi:hypothetical protein